MNIGNASKQAAKELLLAELVYRSAVEKHRQEKSELSRRVVAEAHRQLLQVQRDVMVSAWELPAENLIKCPRCRSQTLAHHWSAHRDTEAPTETADEGGKPGPRRPPQRAAPKWAAPFARAGATAVTRYCCTQCGFSIAMLDGTAAAVPRPPNGSDPHEA